MAYHDEIETGCPVHQTIQGTCPECGKPLQNDGAYHIWCTNNDCDYEEWSEDPEPMDIGEIW